MSHLALINLFIKLLITQLALLLLPFNHFLLIEVIVRELFACCLVLLVKYYFTVLKIRKRGQNRDF